MHTTTLLPLLFALLAPSALSHALLPRGTPPPPPLPVTPDGLTNVLNIVYRFGEHTRDDNHKSQAVVIYTSKLNKNAACSGHAPLIVKELGYAALPGSEDASPPTKWPGGEYPIKPYGGECWYKSNGDNAGALWCRHGDGIDMFASCDREGAADGNVKDVTASGVYQHCNEGYWEMPWTLCKWHK
jgi:hypothetical protein